MTYAIFRSPTTAYDGTDETPVYLTFDGVESREKAIDTIRFYKIQNTYPDCKWFIVEQVEIL